ncbi:DUF1360 domain-containing protein [Bacillus sp. T33-2]|uniref:DUF1360 domain-containing protein n=1 Tax=Bacillus sp. T33-2 TaxID=2054168 RepID=UPI000C78EB29|nr:DUF1360 domain-containing protein [Bacillus sp. T33-2]PLR97747.1 sporulation protein [Bacillus sp. T33-2]
MEITILDFVILCFASFRLTRMLVYDKIAEFIRRPFFDELAEMNEAGETEIYVVPKQTGIRGFFGDLLSCYWCTGVWASGILIIMYYFHPAFAVPVLLVLAVAGVASLIELGVQVLQNE